MSLAVRAANLNHGDCPASREVTLVKNGSRTLALVNGRTPMHSDPKLLCLCEHRKSTGGARLIDESDQTQKTQFASTISGSRTRSRTERATIRSCNGNVSGPG